jgi:hypothetical protein
MVMSQPGQALPLPVRAVSRTIRKIALLGSHSASLVDAPWSDPSWELWGHASARAWYKRELDRYFDVHLPSCRKQPHKKAYRDWLSRNTVPIWMQDKYADVPASCRYPKGRILAEFAYAHQRQYFKNHVAWMIALAITEGVTHIGLFGVNYGTNSEYEMQRGSAEYWLGQLDGRGINVILPEQCTLLAEPKGLYGYESHDEEGRLTPAYAARFKKPAITPLAPGETFAPAQVPAHLVDQIAADEVGRPNWTLAPVTGRSDGQAAEA